jgi:tRNA 2-thiouridine synthesizing protein A
MSGRDYSKPSMSDKDARERGDGGVAEMLDLRGVRCPLNWAKAKVQLEALPRGGELELIVDDPKGARDIPQAAEAEGYAVIEVEARPHDWRLVIRV